MAFILGLITLIQNFPSIKKLLVIIFFLLFFFRRKMPNTDETNHKDSATSNKEKEKKHDSGSADLEKVTDFAEVHTIFKIIKNTSYFFS